MYYDTFIRLHGWREEIYKTPLGLLRLRRGGAVPTRRQTDMEPSTFSRATSALRRGVTNVWFVQDRLSHRLYWLHDWDCGLVVWVCTADHLEDEEASDGGQLHDTTTWAAYTAWLGYARTQVLGRYVNHHAARRDRV